MKELFVELAERRYPIFIGENILNQPNLLNPYIQSKQVLIVTNVTIQPLYLDALKSVLTDYQVDVCVLPDGEQYKDLQHFAMIIDKLLSCKFNRNCTVIALGGGVIGDMTGFAAASYQRGVHFIQIPTTLLSQVDSSVGGKTGVNHPLGKNMIGAFYQPRAVVADVGVLRSLPPRELSAGLAEVIKYGIIWDEAFFDWLEAHMPRLIGLENDALSYAILRSCQIKAEVVSEDETEQGVRALLNLGHTYGHAIETEMGYGQVLHGEAVAIGTVLACATSVQMNLMTSAQMNRVVALLMAANLPVSIPDKMTLAAFLTHMAIDKKAENGIIKLILPHGIGRAEVHADVTTDLISAVINSLL